VALTLGMMRQFGVAVTADNGRYHVPQAGYVAPGDYDIEGDASGASYFLALGAVAGGPIVVRGVGSASLQGDLAFADLVRAMGAEVTIDARAVRVQGPGALAGGARLRAFDVDATRIPDAAMTAAVMALFADGPCRLRGIGSWRVKETDRIAAMHAELTKVGAVVESGEDWLRVTPPVRFQSARIHTYDDHRMAMCLSLAAAGGVPMHILDPGCVAKTYPRYFEALASLRQNGSPA
jgi:3-phosphoshikimate 1-carboxyvinyltransferase